MEQLTTTIHAASPFSLELTAGYQTNFQGETGADVFEGGVYRRLLEWKGRLRLLSVRAVGTVDEPELEVTVAGQGLTSSDLTLARQVVAHILSTEVDLRPFYRKAADDPVLAPLVERLYGLHLSQMPSVFEGLVFAITGQQIASRVARLIRTLIVQRFGPSMLMDGRLYRAFPSPQRLLEIGTAGLREVKLSTRKAEYILDIAAQGDRGVLDLEGMAMLPSAEVVKRLTALRGVGRWTAEWVMLRALSRPDVFPAGDLALRRAVSALGGSEGELSEAEVRAFGERWGPFKSLATVYIFAARHLEQH